MYSVTAVRPYANNNNFKGNTMSFILKSRKKSLKTNPEFSTESRRRSTRLLTAFAKGVRRHYQEACKGEQETQTPPHLLALQLLKKMPKSKTRAIRYLKDKASQGVCNHTEYVREQCKPIIRSLTKQG